MAPVFNYHAKDKNGNDKKSAVEAVNEKDASAKLHAQGLVVISMKEVETAREPAEERSAKKIRTFKILFIASIVFLFIRALLLSYVEERVLAAASVWVALIINSGYIGVLIVFLFYLYGAAKVLKENHIIDLPPWLALTLEVVLTVLFFGIGGLIIPIYIWVKSRKLAGALMAKPFDVKKSPEEYKARTKASVIGTLIIVGGAFIELSLLTVGLYAVLYTYALNGNSLIFVGYFIALVFGAAVVAGGIGTVRRRRWGRIVLISLSPVVVIYILFLFFTK